MGLAPEGKGNPMRCVLSVLGKDRPGIVAAMANTLGAAVAGALSECNGNIVDISQTILGDIFSMTMIVAIADDSDVFNSLQENLKTTGEDLGVQTVLQREDVFQYMYKI